MCVCVCMRVCVRACMYARACACVCNNSDHWLGANLELGKDLFQGFNTGV